MKKEFKLPYGKGYEVLTLGEEHLAGVLTSGIQGYRPTAEGGEPAAMAAAMGFDPMEEKMFITFAAVGW